MEKINKTNLIESERDDLKKTSCSSIRTLKDENQESNLVCEIKFERETNNLIFNNRVILIQYQMKKIRDEKKIASWKKNYLI